MWVRKWKCVCPRENEAGFLKYLSQTGVNDTKQIEGCTGYKVLRREMEKDVEVTLETYWESLASIKKYSGPDIYKAVLYPEDGRYKIIADETVSIYEVVDNPLQE